MSEGNWAFTCPTCKHRYKWTGPMAPTPPCPKCQRAHEIAKQQKQQQPAGSVRVPVTGDSDDDDAYEEAIGLCDEIESLADDVPSAGENFASSVCEKTAEIRQSIAASGRATPNQIRALENMRDGLARWIRD